MGEKEMSIKKALQKYIEVKMNIMGLLEMSYCEI